MVLVTKWIEGWRWARATGRGGLFTELGDMEGGAEHVGWQGDNQYGLDMSSWMHPKDGWFSSAGEGFGWVIPIYLKWKL